MSSFLHPLLQFLSIVFGWITSNAVHIGITFAILILGTIALFFLRIYPYKKYPKNIKVILPGEIIHSVKSFFVSIVILVILYVITGVGVQVDAYLSQMHKLDELQTVYKNINQDYLLADITVTDIRNTSNKSVLTLNVSYYSYGDRKNAVFSEKVFIEGSAVYIDCNQYNFEYSQISTGENKNLALPYRIFSNTVAASDGVILNAYDSEGIPYIFERTENNIWGIDTETYTDRVAELVAIMNNSNKSQKEGILRSSSGSALHFLAEKDKTYRIYASQSGGLTLSKKSDWL